MKNGFGWMLLLGLGGCTLGGDDSAGAGGASAADAGVDTSTVDARGEDAAGEDASAEPPKVEGTWAQVLFYASINDIPAVGQTNGSTTTIQRTTIERVGTSLSMRVEACAIEVDSGTPVVSTIIPDAVVASLGLMSRTGSLVPDGSRWRFVQAEILQLRGVKLADPINEALPTQPGDPRIWDQDLDGHPGVTVRITGITDGEVYVVQRDTHALDGLVNGDQMDGLAEWSTEQSVLDSDNPILKLQTNSVKDPNAQASYFRSTRIEASKGCDAILAERAQLFGR